MAETVAVTPSYTTSDKSGVFLNPTEAAELVGCSRALIYQKVKRGELSRRPDGDFDPAELLRCFGEFKGTKDKALEQSATPAPDNNQVDRLWSLVDELRDEKAELLKQLQEKDSDAREREEVWLRQLDNLTSRLLPPPEPDEPQPEPEKPGFFRKLFV